MIGYKKGMTPCIVMDIWMYIPHIFFKQEMRLDQTNFSKTI
jgi:hypothetical protein